MIGWHYTEIRIMVEEIPRQVNKAKGWQKVARQTYRVSAEKASLVGKLTPQEKRVQELAKELDETAEEGVRIRRGSDSGLQSEGRARIETQDYGHRGDPVEEAARKILEDPSSRDDLNE